jgi:class 3 adenylate cyclase
VLFSDLVESTRLLSRLGEATFDQVRRAHFEALGHAVERTGGKQVKTLGTACWPSSAPPPMPWPVRWP